MMQRLVCQGARVVSSSSAIGVDSVGAARRFASSSLCKVADDIARPRPDNPLAGSQGKKLVAAAEIRKGEMVIHGSGEIGNELTLYTLQVDLNRHLILDNEAKYYSHSENPNSCVKYTTECMPVFFALRDIEAGEDLTYNYNTAEWETCPFVDSETGEEVRGFKHLSPAKRLTLLEADVLAPYIMKLWLRELVLDQHEEHGFQPDQRPYVDTLGERLSRSMHVTMMQARSE